MGLCNSVKRGLAVLGQSTGSLVLTLQCGGCATAPQPVTARIASVDQATLDKIQSVLSLATGNKRIKLGAFDPEMMTAVPALPPALSPYETRSPAKPIMFDVVLRGRSCYLVNRQSRLEYSLNQIACVPVVDATKKQP